MASSNEQNKIFVGGLPRKLCKEKLQAYFSGWGLVNSAVVIKNRGFGFVAFANKSAQEACLLEPFHFIEGKQVSVKRSIPKEDICGKGQATTTMLCVEGLPPHVQLDDLLQHFGRYAAIESAWLLPGVGFLQFLQKNVDRVLYHSPHTVRSWPVKIFKCNHYHAVPYYQSYIYYHQALYRYLLHLESEMGKWEEEIIIVDE